MVTNKKKQSMKKKKRAKPRSTSTSNLATGGAVGSMLLNPQQQKSLSIPQSLSHTFTSLLIVYTIKVVPQMLELFQNPVYLYLNELYQFLLILRDNPSCCCSFCLRKQTLLLLCLNSTICSSMSCSLFLLPTLTPTVLVPKIRWIGGHTEPHLAPVSSMNS